MPLSEMVRVRAIWSGVRGNFEVGAVQPHLIVGEGLVGQLVHRVAGVGDQLPQEDLLVGVDGVDHQIQQPLGLGLELFLAMTMPPVSQTVL